ncbi:hypothetical protein M0802_004870 [Mischocyttarus mexicanus]|nr:hypothetical protein M0802_004870 [Mischocyttarus mexicanus]
MFWITSNVTTNSTKPIQISSTISVSPRVRRSIDRIIPWANLTNANFSNRINNNIINNNNISFDLPIEYEEDITSEDCSSMDFLLELFHTYYIPAIILLGLVGNLLSCVVFLNTHLKMRSSSYYLAALATADFGFLVSLLLVWLNDTVGLVVFNKDGWCETLVYVSAVCSSLSVWLIVAFTVERFIAVQYPLHRPHICTIARAKAIILILVILALASHSYAFITAGVVKVNDGYEFCGLKIEHLETMRIISIIDTIASLIVPLVLITVMNTMIMRNLLRFSRRFKQTPSVSTTCPSRERSEINLNQIPDNRLPHDSPLPLFGNFAKFFFRRKPVHLILADAYNKYSQTKYFGFYDFRSPVIILRDPELINSIGIKNFDNFSDHTSFVIEHEPLLARNLFQLRGDTWREMRKLLSPTFTSSKMKMMFGLIQECATNFVRHIENKSENGWTTEMKDVFTNYTNDVVATTAFGIRIDSMKDPNNEFITLVKKVLNFDSIISLKLLLGRNFPWLFKIFGIKLFGDKVHNFFRNVIIESIKTRENNGIVRPDMLQLMMESRDKMQLSYDDMTSQAFVFFLAGADSTATFMCFLAHELALNTEVQIKLREEIDQCLKLTNGQPTYDVIMNMKYLDAVVNETLRLHPLTTFVDRFCSKSFELPPSMPGEKSFIINPGTSVWFLPYSIHRDPKYYPNPNKLDPNRFIDGNIDPLVYFPFGIGPRICIGNRYALIIIKIVFFHFLARCELKLCPKTPIPMRYSKKSMVMTAENGFWLKIMARKETTVLADRDEITNN